VVVIVERPMIDVSDLRTRVIDRLVRLHRERWIERDVVAKNQWEFSVRPDHPQAATLYLETDGTNHADVQCEYGAYEHPNRWTAEAILAFVDAVCEGRIVEVSLQTSSGHRVLTATTVSIGSDPMESIRYHLPLALIPLPLYMGTLKTVRRRFVPYETVKV
jgi:hypothetical protein